MMPTLVMEKKNDSFSIIAWMPVLIGLTVWLWFCGPMIAGSTVVGFRDSGYLYYPLFQWIDDQWAAGEFPLWNPYCNLGMPIVGDGTSSLLYPGKLVFCCRFLSFPSRYGIYLAVHLLLAGVGTYWLARVLKSNSAGATLAAISYAFGGCVLFQVTNVIFLVSAAWLPVALACVWKMIMTGDVRWAVATGVVCASMILGGDPQMVYHVGLIGAATMASKELRHWRRSRKDPSPNRYAFWKSSARSMSLLATMVLVTVLLSLVQLLPSYQWAQLSERTQSDRAANVYQLFAQGGLGDFGLQSIKQNFFEPTEPNSPADHVYQFSLPPWTLAELFWPNVSGKLFPTHQRWTDVFPGTDRIWFASLYFGLLTIWIAIGGIRCFGRSRYVWLTRIGLFFGIASFGWYGSVWLINEILPARFEFAGVGPQVGGIYWLMVILLPKYFAFRYPAKLLIVTSLCLCLLAGIRLRHWRWNFSGTWVYFYGGATAIGLCVLMCGWHDTLFAKIPTDPLFGPFDADGTTRSLRNGLVQAGLVLGVAVVIGYFQKNRTPNAGSNSPAQPLGNKKRSANLALWTIVGITAIDLIVANRWLLSEVPANTFRRESDLTSQHRLLADWNAVGPPTIYRPRGEAFLPKSWSQAPSPHRLAEILGWQQNTLYPKHHLGCPVRLVGSFSSIWPVQYENILSSIEQRDAADQKDGGNPNPLSDLPDYKVQFCDAEVSIAGVGNKQRITLKPLADRPKLVFLAHLSDDARSGTERSSRLLKGKSGDSIQPIVGPNAKCELLSFGNSSLAAQVATNQPCWLVHNSICDGNWQARIKNQATGEVSTHGLIDLAAGYQGISIDEGEYDVALIYQPSMFRIAAWISGGSWVLLIIGFVGLRIPINRVNDDHL